MPQPEVVNQQKTLQIAVLIGWGCLIYNHRYFSVISPNDPIHEHHEELLDCINVLLCAAGYQDEYKEIEILFQNYATDEQLQNKVQTFLRHLESTPIDRVNKWYKTFSESDISSATIKEIELYETAKILHAGYLLLKLFEQTLNFKKYSMLFTEALEGDIQIFLDFDMFWNLPLNFLVSGFNFFAQGAWELTTLQNAIFGFYDKVLIVDLEAIAATPNNLAALQELIKSIRMPICANICNIDLFNMQQRKILYELKKLLQSWNIIELPNIPQAGFHLQDRILIIDLQAITEDVNTFAALQQQISEIDTSICVNVCNIDVFNTKQRKTLAELKKILQAIPYNIYEFNVYLALELQNLFNDIISKQHCNSLWHLELDLQQYLLYQLYCLHAQILSMPNIRANNLDNNYWHHLLWRCDAVLASNWLGDLHRHLHEQSRIIQEEEKTYNILRNEILGWNRSGRTAAARPNARTVSDGSIIMAHKDRTLHEKIKHRPLKILQ